MGKVKCNRDKSLPQVTTLKKHIQKKKCQQKWKHIFQHINGGRRRNVHAKILNDEHLGTTVKSDVVGTQSQPKWISMQNGDKINGVLPVEQNNFVKLPDNQKKRKEFPSPSTSSQGPAKKRKILTNGHTSSKTLRTHLADLHGIVVESTSEESDVQIVESDTTSKNSPKITSQTPKQFLKPRVSSTPNTPGQKILEETGNLNSTLLDDEESDEDDIEEAYDNEFALTEMNFEDSDLDQSIDEEDEIRTDEEIYEYNSEDDDTFDDYDIEEEELDEEEEDEDLESLDSYEIESEYFSESSEDDDESDENAGKYFYQQYHSSEDESYEPGTDYVEDLYVPRGTATTFSAGYLCQLPFDDKSDEPQVIDVTEYFNKIENAQQDESNDDSESSESDSSCPKLVPIKSEYRKKILFTQINSNSLNFMTNE